MCGRYTLITNIEMIFERFNVDVGNLELQPRYNIAPGQLIPAIIEDGGQRRLGQLKWGLVPVWAENEKIGYKLVNARAETLEEKPAFRRLLERKRCLVPADGFYEWQQRPEGKQPMRIMLKSQELFAFAGLFDSWTRSDGEKVHSCTIITTTPNDVVKGIHDRMPVILRPEDEAIWLDRDHYDTKLIRSLLVPYDAELMRAYPVSSIVGNAKNDVPQCIEELV
ncbi:SOS response-associated peptidase [Brevibacillus fluminis]|uniref:SOS response-associated peptidase n=1 Tax=Brevibacillus fluminis TaxID=511487 RepID=UPI003F89A713